MGKERRMSDLIMPVAKVTAQVDLKDIKAGLEKEDIVRVVRCKDCKHRYQRIVNIGIIR